MNAMRMGPGKHLQGLTLMNGAVKPEEVCQRLPVFVCLLTPTLPQV